MNVLRTYLWTASVPFLVCIGVSSLALTLAFVALSRVEDSFGRTSPFAYTIPDVLHDCPFWVAVLAGQWIVSALAMFRSGRLELEIAPDQRGAAIPLPIFRTISANILYLGGMVLMFYLLRDQFILAS